MLNCRSHCLVGGCGVQAHPWRRGNYWAVCRSQACRPRTVDQANHLNPADRHQRTPSQVRCLYANNLSMITTVVLVPRWGSPESRGLQALQEWVRLARCTIRVRAKSDLQGLAEKTSRHRIHKDVIQSTIITPFSSTTSPTNHFFYTTSKHEVRSRRSARLLRLRLPMGG